MAEDSSIRMDFRQINHDILSRAAQTRAAPHAGFALFTQRSRRMTRRSRAIAFDVDKASFASLQEALPGWQLDVVAGATVASLPCDWNPGAVDLLVVGSRENVTETLGLCRFLAVSALYSRD